MNQHHSTLAKLYAKRKQKPRRPPGFPLFCHSNGQWAKKVRGKLVYFGPWSDPPAALEKWLRQKDDLLAGRTPRDHDPDALTVGNLCNLFLESRERRVATGELAQCTFDDYLVVAASVIEKLGRGAAVEHLRPADFAELRAHLAKGCNLKTLEGRIACARAIFNHADRNGMLNTPLSKLWGTEFSKPSKSALHKLKNETTRLFDAAEIWRLLNAASATMQAMIWLGINGGMGNTDVAKLRFDHLDLKAGWLTMARSKTGKPRRFPLWPETVKALEAAIEHRPTHKNATDADLVFVTKYGNSWIPKAKDNPISKEFDKVRVATGITAKGKTFYTLRHTFQTIGDETRDFVAVSAIMGHAASSISDHYRERIGDDRLQAVVNHVRGWLLKAKPKRQAKPKARTSSRKGGAV